MARLHYLRELMLNEISDVAKNLAHCFPRVVLWRDATDLGQNSADGQIAKVGVENRHTDV